MTKPTGRPTGRPPKDVPKQDHNITSSPTPEATPAPPLGTVDRVEYAQRRVDAEADRTEPDATRAGLLKSALDTAKESLKRADDLAKDAKTSLANTQAEEGPIYRLTVSHLAALLKEAAIESKATVVTMEGLRDEIDRLKTRLDSADKWDAQERQKRIDAQAVEDAKSKEEKRRDRQARLSSVAASLQAQVDEDTRQEKSEESLEALERQDVRWQGYTTRYGQKGCTAWNEHQAVVFQRIERKFELALADRLVSGQISEERAAEIRIERQAKRIHDQGEAEAAEVKRILRTRRVSSAP